MIWIYSFGSDTTQGGYETCVKRVSPRQLKALRPDIEQVDFCSDAGSGYKSTQTILDLRNAKKTTGIRVRKLHFNASWEGKRCETDGHNTDIKSRRESAMRAGEPSACITPDSEAQAQLHSGGIPGSYPVVLTLDHKQLGVVGGNLCRSRL
jgi:hypothetical protein